MATTDKLPFGPRSTPPRLDQAQRLAKGLGWFGIGLGTAQLLAPDQIARMIGMREDKDGHGIMRLYGLREIAAGMGIVTAVSPISGMAARVAGDMVDLVSLGLVAGSPNSDRRRAAVAAAAVLGVTALDVYCSRILTRAAVQEGYLRMTKTIIVNRSPEAVYSFWRQLENFSSLIERLEIESLNGGRRTRWCLTAPGGKRVRWEAEMVADRPQVMIGWHSNPGADIPNAGTVRFERATGGRGTLVKLQMAYRSPAGKTGAVIAKLFGMEPGQLIETALRRMKQMLETGTIIRSDAGNHAGMHAAPPPAGATRQAASAGTFRVPARVEPPRKEALS